MLEWPDLRVMFSLISLSKRFSKDLNVKASSHLKTKVPSQLATSAENRSWLNNMRSKISSL